MADFRGAHLRVVGSVLGLIGGVVCSVSMVLVAVASVGAMSAAVAGSMSGMAGNGPHRQPVLAALVQWGPAILVLSIVLITIGVASRTARSGLAVLAAGGILYWGMYIQASLAIMYLAIGFGLLVWAAVVALELTRFRGHPAYNLRRLHARGR